LKLYTEALRDPQFRAVVPSADNIRVLLDEPEWTLSFQPHPGWVGHVEASRGPREAA
jgi:hypothetical protein